MFLVLRVLLLYLQVIKFSFAKEVKACEASNISTIKLAIYEP